MSIKINLRKALLISLLSPLLIVGIGYAQTDTNPETTDNTATTTNTTSSGLAPKPTTTLAERLAEHKAALQTKITTAQQARIKGRCVSAQAKLTQYLTKVDEVQAKRTAAHLKILESLNNIVTKIGDKADTTELQAGIVTIKSKTDSLDAGIVDFKQQVSDAAELDCVADPTGFQATMESLRTQRLSLIQDSEAVRAYYRDSIKPLLEKLRTTLQATKEEGSN